MDTFVVVAGLCISTAALAYLAHTDPKRRRVFGRPQYEKRRRIWLSLFILSAPGVWFMMSGNGAGFTVWLGGVSVVGWGVAAMNPHRAAAVATLAGRWRCIAVAGGRRSAAAVRAAHDFYHSLGDTPARVAVLERRVDELEAKLAIPKMGGASSKTVRDTAASHA